MDVPLFRDQRTILLHLEGECQRASRPSDDALTVDSDSRGRACSALARFAVGDVAPSLRRHFAEYVCEYLGTAIMMTIGIGAVALFWGRASPMPEIIPSTRLRLFCTGLLFAGGGTLV